MTEPKDDWDTSRALREIIRQLDGPTREDITRALQVLATNWHQEIGLTLLRKPPRDLLGGELTITWSLKMPRRHGAYQISTQVDIPQEEPF